MSRAAVTFVLSFAICLPAAGQDNVNAADRAFRAGVAAAQAQQFAQAEQQFRTVVRLAPGISAGHSALGAVLVQRGNNAIAIPELRTALQLNPEDSAAQLNMGIACAAVLGTATGTPAQTDEGIAAFHAWQQRHGAALPADAAIALAKLYTAKKHPEQATRALDDALAASPADASLLDSSGVLLAQQGQFTQAEARFRSALSAATSPEQQAEFSLHLGSTLLAEGNAAAALAELQRAVSLAPERTEARVQLGAAQFQAGQESAALATLRAALAQDQHSDVAAYQLALTLESMGRNDEALPLFARVAKARPNDADLLTNYGLALVQTGKAKDAIALYLRAVPLAPQNATLHQDLGVAYLQQSDLDNAIAEFTRGSELDPQSAQLAYDLGLALKLKDRYPESIAAFEKARALDPQLADAPYTLGVLYMQQGDFGKAAEVLQQAVALRPDNAEAWAMLGSVWKQDGKPKEAADALRRAIALDPGQPGSHVNLASVLMELGEKDEAIRERKTAAELSRAATAQQKERFALDSGRLLQQRGQFAEAITQFRNAVAASPDDPAAHLALADALAQSGAKADAEMERSRAESLQKKP